ncbi:MAG: serine hydrolase, partial [Acidobacteria bacterium]|nr:serine hydrolase [Acidobacteriota bacterium]
MTRYIGALVLAAASWGVLGQERSLDRSVATVAERLLPPVIVRGRPLQTQTLENRMRELNVPGVSVAVFKDGRIEWTRGWGYADIASKRTVERDTRFQAASISKPVAAAVVLALVSRERLSLDRPVNEHLTSWTLPDNGHTAGKPVTLRFIDGRKSYEVKKPFEGVLGNLQRRFNQTESAWMREELSRYQGSRPCETCSGARLKPEALSVKIAGEHISSGSQRSVADALAWFATLDAKLTP